MTPRTFNRRVLDWFDACERRELPWQEHRSGYSVWVSEIMLQQTQVTTVIPYFERFVRRFPNINTLANGSLDDVLQHWSGLGYYARARNLHRAAQIICQKHNGVVPERYEDLIALPGIGRSTAGAILSLAFGQRQAILDGNVKRLLCRHRAIKGWPGHTAVSKQLWQLAEQLTPDSQVANYNQAMMDLGATVCTRKQPHCAVCPIASDCVAQTKGCQHALPTPRPRKILPVRETYMLIVHNTDGEVLLQRRPPQGIWGGLLSFPEAASKKAGKQWCEESLGIAPEILCIWPVRRHTFSHFHLKFTPMELSIDNSIDYVMEGDGLLWYNLHSLPGSVAAPIKQVLVELQERSNGPRGEMHQTQ